MKKKAIQIIYIFLIFNFFTLMISCSKKQDQLPSPQNFDLYIQAVSKKMCAKMHRCYGKIFRTLPSHKRKKMTHDECVQTVLNNKKQKLSLHTPEMKKYSISCYSKILEAPCTKFGEVAFFEPECVKLNYIADKVYKGSKPPTQNLPWDLNTVHK